MTEAARYRACAPRTAGDVVLAILSAVIDRRYSFHQNLTRNVVWRLRMALAPLGNPKSALLTIVFQELNVTWFKTFVASTLRSTLKRSPQGNVLPSVAFKPNCE